MCSFILLICFKSLPSVMISSYEVRGCRMLILNRYIFLIEACSSTTFGQNCGGQCACNFNNTRSCDKRVGTCYCTDGWQGVNCTEDVLECNVTSNICGNNSVCQETTGSYKCVCKPGYTKSSKGYCESLFLVAY